MRSSAATLALLLLCLLALGGGHPRRVATLLWKTGDAFPTGNATLDTIVRAISTADAVFCGFCNDFCRQRWWGVTTVYLSEQAAPDIDGAIVVGSPEVSETVLWRKYARDSFWDYRQSTATVAVVKAALGDIFAMTVDALANPNATQQRSPGHKRWVMAHDCSHPTECFAPNRSAPGDAGIRDAWAPSCLDMRGDAAQGTAAATPFPSTAAQMTVPPYTDQTSFSLLNSMVITHTFAILADGDTQSGVAGIGIEAAYALFMRARTHFRTDPYHGSIYDFSQSLRSFCRQLSTWAVADHEGKPRVRLNASACEMLDRAMRATGMGLPLPARLAPPQALLVDGASIADVPLYLGSNGTDELAFFVYWGDLSSSEVTVAQGDASLSWNCSGDLVLPFNERVLANAKVVCAVPPPLAAVAAPGAATLEVAPAGGQSLSSATFLLPSPAVDSATWAKRDGADVVRLTGAFAGGYESSRGREHVVVRLCWGDPSCCLGPCVFPDLAKATRVFTRFPDPRELVVPVRMHPDVKSFDVYVSQHAGRHWAGPFTVRRPAEGSSLSWRTVVLCFLAGLCGVGGVFVVLGVLARLCESRRTRDQQLTVPLNDN
eukprot:m51a1_g318 hypothetical protein (602) ;mRNA; f:425389-427671